MMLITSALLYRPVPPTVRPAGALLLQISTWGYRLRRGNRSVQPAPAACEFALAGDRDARLPATGWSGGSRGGVRGCRRRAGHRVRPRTIAHRAPRTSWNSRPGRDFRIERPQARTGASSSCGFWSANPARPARVAVVVICRRSAARRQPLSAAADPTGGSCTPTSPTDEIGAHPGGKEQMRRLLASRFLPHAADRRCASARSCWSPTCPRPTDCGPTIDAWSDAIEVLIVTAVTNARTEAADIWIERTGRPPELRELPRALSARQRRPDGSVNNRSQRDRSTGTGQSRQTRQFSLSQASWFGL
jgi:hypothetical protein